MKRCYKNYHRYLKSEQLLDEGKQGKCKRDKKTETKHNIQKKTHQQLPPWNGQLALKDKDLKYKCPSLVKVRKRYSVNLQDNELTHLSIFKEKGQTDLFIFKD